MSVVGQQGAGFQPTGTSGGGVPLFPQPNGRMAGRNAPTAQQLLAGGQLPGGQPLPPQFQTPVGPVEQGFAGGAAGGLPFASSVAAGQIPPGMLAQYNQLQQQNQARILDAMGGARFGSDIAGVLGRESGRSLTDLLAGTQANALGAFQGFANPLFQAEQQRAMGGQQMAWQNFLQQQQLPQALSLLLTLAGFGGGTTSGNQATSQWQAAGKL